MRWSWRLALGLLGVIPFLVAFINLVVAALILDLLEVWAWVALVLGMVLVAVPVLKILWAITSPSAMELERQRADLLYDELEETRRERHQLLNELHNLQARKELCQDELNDLEKRREDLIKEIERLRYEVAEAQERPENPLDPSDPHKW